MEEEALVEMVWLRNNTKDGSRKNGGKLCVVVVVVFVFARKFKRQLLTRGYTGRSSNRES